MPELDNINVLAELERSGIKFEFAAQDEVKVLCPFHADTSPSCFISTSKRLFNCRTAGCEAHGDFVSFLARLLRTNRATVLTDLATRYLIDNSKLVDAQLVERYHSAIWQAGPLLQELYKRGVTDKIIRDRRLGELDGRITIPIKNEQGLYVNLRKYLPGAPGKDKMRNLRGHGQARLYPIDQLAYDHILICGGECKALVAAEQLNPHNIGAITATCGEDNWGYELSKKLEGKAVWICLDIDAAGRLAARQRCLELKRFVSWVSEPIILPLDIDKYPKGDINDFIGQEGSELLPLLQSATEFIADTTPIDFADDTPPEELELIKAIHADSTAKRIAVKAIVSAIDTAPYVIPREVQILCSKDQNECAICPVATGQVNVFSIPPESPSILEMVGNSKNNQLESVKGAVGIPLSCKVCSFLPNTFYTVEDARISPALDITNRSSDRLMQQAFCIGGGLELNETYNLVGRMFPHPENQQSTLLISKHITAQNALSSFELTEPEKLGVFWQQERSAESIQQKLNEICSDFEANVTRIFCRRDLHLVVDLTYHSPLWINFDGKIHKGWLETLILGDPSQGKSEVACGADGNGGLMTHFGLGQRVDCRNASVAGIFGGLEQIGGRYIASWGVIPTNDKGLVILEELKGLSIDCINKLTDVRSSGKAEIAKIKKLKTNSRVRLAAISNLRSDLKVSQLNYGIEAVKELIGSLEDIRRFDLALLISSAELADEEINKLQSHRPQIEHIYTSDLCRTLILWAWTRTPDQILFSPDATDLIMQQAIMFCKKFNDSIPLVDKGSMRLKLARLSAALAARLFSCDESYEKLIILPEHVEFIVQMIDRIYSSPTFGYADYSKAIEINQTMLDPDYVTSKISATPYPIDLIKQILAKNKIDLQDLQDWCGWERDPAMDLLSALVRKHCFIRDGRGYRKTAKFITMLKNYLDNGAISALKDRPPHLQGKDF